MKINEANKSWIISTFAAVAVALLSAGITIYTVGANKTNEEVLRAMKARVDRSEIRLSQINKEELPGLRAFDAGVAATIEGFRSDFLEIKEDVKTILAILREHK